MVQAWHTLKSLAVRPAEGLEELLVKRTPVVPLLLGAMSHFAATAQVSELILPSPLAGRAYLLFNLPLALSRMILTLSVFHLACRPIARGRGRWRDLLILWGYTELPALLLTLLAAATFIGASRASLGETGIEWTLGLLGIAILLALWGVVLKFQALKVCYALAGWRLWTAIALALSLVGATGWLERLFVAEQGLIPFTALRAMEPAVPASILGRKNLSLPFDTLTYHLQGPQRGEIVSMIPPRHQGLMALPIGARRRALARIVALPGETVGLEDGQVFIDGRPLSEPYRLGGSMVSLPPTPLPPGHLFVLGDNREVPMEGYEGGVVAVERIRGRLTDAGRLTWGLMLGKGPW